MILQIISLENVSLLISITIRRAYMNISRSDIILKFFSFYMMSISLITYFLFISVYIQNLFFFMINGSIRFQSISFFRNNVNVSYHSNFFFYTIINCLVHRATIFIILCLNRT